MIEILDILKEEFSLVEISNADKNGKKYVNTRWFYPQKSDRFHNVFIEVWDHPRVRRVDVVLYRELMTPVENALATLDGNDRINVNRGKLELHNISSQDLYDFIRAKVKLYCDKYC